MKKHFFWILILALLLASCGNSEQLTKKENEIRSLMKENMDLQSQNKELSYQLQLKEQELKYLKETMKRNNQEMAKIEEQIKNLQNLEKDFAVLQTEKKALEEKFQDKIQGMSEEVKNNESALKEKTDQLKKLEEQLQKLQDENLKLKMETEKQKHMIQELEQKLKQKDDQAQKEQVKVKEMEQTVQNFQAQILQKEQELANLKDTVAELREFQTQMKKETDKIKEKFEKEIKSGEVVVDNSYRRIKVMMMEKIIFRKSEISLTPQGEEILKKVAEVLKDIQDKEIFVIGHADSDPVKDPIIRKIFPTNWEFSVMRSVMVVRYLTEILGVKPSLFTAAGRSYYHPIVKETSEKNKTINRRTEILIFPKFEKVQSKTKISKINKKFTFSPCCSYLS